MRDAHERKVMGVEPGARRRQPRFPGAIFGFPFRPRSLDGAVSGKTNPLRSSSCHQSREQIPEAIGEFGRSCRKLSMWGSCGWSLIIRRDQQARASPKPKGGARWVWAGFGQNALKWGRKGGFFGNLLRGS